MPTTVVHLKRSRSQVIQDCDVYIGRECKRGGWDLEQSKWYNPFTVARYGSAEEAVRQYEAYVRTKPELMACLKELEGKRLGCWCKPRVCHGDVLIKLMRERASDQC